MGWCEFITMLLSLANECHNAKFSSRILCTFQFRQRVIFMIINLFAYGVLEEKLVETDGISNSFRVYILPLYQQDVAMHTINKVFMG